MKNCTENTVFRQETLDEKRKWTAPGFPDCRGKDNFRFSSTECDLETAFTTVYISGVCTSHHLETRGELDSVPHKYACPGILINVRYKFRL